MKWVALLALALAAAAVADTVSVLAPDRSADGFTVERADEQAYLQPAPVLDHRQQSTFLRGRSHFTRRWVVFAANGEWGLGPTFIAERCSDCHVNGGRGTPPATPGEPLLSMLVRLSIPGDGEHGAPRPHPAYGDQFQNRALQGQSFELDYTGAPVPHEADLSLEWEEHAVSLSDGEQVRLQRPRLRIEHLAFGPLGDSAMTSLRIASPLVGLGLLEAVPESTILELARRQQAFGINGRPNYVWDAIDQRIALGRFGWKANQASLKQQIAAAAIGDMGVTSDLYIEQNCPPVQTICRDQIPGGVRELIDNDWDEFEFWLRGSAVPARRNVTDARFAQGERLFEQVKCAVCHVPQLRTAERFSSFPLLAGRSIRAYTDLLLHDMGEELADGRPDFRAGPRDWRTPPLWGLGLSRTVNASSAMLHDGRARTVTEAIMWHGGEAAASREAFSRLHREERAALVYFLDSI